MPVISSTPISRLDWRDTALENTITLEKETVQNEAGEDYVRIKASCPNLPEINPRYGADRMDAVEALQRALWVYHSNNGDAEKANKA